ncbi:MAG: C25 family cysteine peptidase [Anaerolineae bacterium]
MRRGLVLLLVILISGCTAQAADPPTASPSGVWFVELAQTGATWLSPQTLRDLGLDTDAAPALRLSMGARDLPYLPLPARRGWGVLFFAPNGTTRYTKRTVVRLEPGVAGDRMPSQPAETTASPAPALATVTWEQDIRYLPQATADVPWLWEPIYTPGALEQTVVLTDAQPGPITAMVRLWSHTGFQPQPDHRAVLAWEGTPVGEWTWSGQGMQTLTATWPLEESGGEHTLTLQTPALVEDKVAVVWIDGWEITYPRRVTQGVYTAAGDALRASPQARVLDVTDPFAPLDLGAVPENGVIGTLRGHRYWIGSPEQAQTPVSLRPAALLDTAALSATEYLVIAPPAFRPPIQPLVDHRKASGLNVAVVSPQSIYDTLGTGQPDPASLRALIQTLPDLRYALLVGDATTEPWGYDGEDGALRVVTPFTRTTVLGETPADALLGTDATGHPRVAVGRFPAASVAEVEAMVAKTLAWEANAAEASSVLLNDDEQEFVSAVDALTALLPEGDDAPRLDAGDPTCRDTLLSTLSDGPRVLTYVGHGSLRQLGDEGVLLIEDGAMWDDPSVVVAWTCLAAHFTHTRQPSMAEVWLAQPQGGVAAFLGPVGETTTFEQKPYAAAFYAALQETPRLGDAWLTALQTPGSRDVRWGFTILGDPALHLPGTSAPERSP